MQKCGDVNGHDLYVDMSAREHMDRSMWLPANGLFLGFEFASRWLLGRGASSPPEPPEKEKGEKNFAGGRMRVRAPQGDIGIRQLTGGALRASVFLPVRASLKHCVIRAGGVGERADLGIPSPSCGWSFSFFFGAMGGMRP